MYFMSGYSKQLFLNLRALIGASVVVSCLHWLRTHERVRNMCVRNRNAYTHRLINVTPPFQCNVECNNMHTHTPRLICSVFAERYSPKSVKE